VSPVSRGRKPKKKTRKRPGNQTRARPPTDQPAPKQWPNLLREPVELSRCVLQSEPDSDTVTLAATLTGGGRSVGVEVFVIEDTVEEIEVHRVPSNALALRRRCAVDLVEAKLSPDEFRRQVEAAMVVYADTDCYHAQRHGTRSARDLPERMTWLRRWLGLPEYEGLPRMPPRYADLLPVTLPPPGPVAGMRIAVGVDELDPVIWRRLEVRSDVTLAGLHRILAVAFNREPGTDHSFRTGYGEFGACERPPDEATLGQVAPGPGHRLSYECEGWCLWIRVENITAVPVAPRCLGGERAAPPEGCNGESAYETLLEALADPDDEYNEEILFDYGLEGGFDPEWFVPAFVTEKLARLR